MVLRGWSSHSWRHRDGRLSQKDRASVEEPWNPRVQAEQKHLDHDRAEATLVSVEDVAVPAWLDNLRVQIQGDAPLHPVPNTQTRRVLVAEWHLVRRRAQPEQKLGQRQTADWEQWVVPPVRPDWQRHHNSPDKLQLDPWASPIKPAEVWTQRQ